jgi:hypothetical protein
VCLEGGSTQSSTQFATQERIDRLVARSRKTSKTTGCLSVVSDETLDLRDHVNDICVLKGLGFSVSRFIPDIC